MTIGLASRVASVGVAALLVGFAVEATSTYKDGPPPNHTGGFGEPTCYRCHHDGPIADPHLSVHLAGAADGYEPGESYTLTVAVAHALMRAGGFQLSSRFAEGPMRGRQAGTLATSDGLRVVTDSAGVEFVSHAVPIKGDSVEWVIGWTAPDSGAVRFDLAVNASNFDDSEFGDFTTSATFLRSPRADAARRSGSPNPQIEMSEDETR